VLGEHTHFIVARVGDNDATTLSGLKVARREAGNRELVGSQTGVRALLVSTAAGRVSDPGIVRKTLQFTIASIGFQINFAQ
jgi:hypothetical protein